MKPEHITPKILIPEVKIKSRVKELGHQISYDYQGKEIIAICVLKGSFVFYSDLVRQIEVPLTCEFLGLSSYGGQTKSSGEVKVTLDITEPLKGRHVLIIEDIVDTGLSLKFLMSTLSARGPASLRSCALLFKPDSLKTQVDINYVGFKIGSEFVVGYGVDYQERMRGLPYIAYVESEH